MEGRVQSVRKGSVWGKMEEGKDGFGNGLGREACQGSKCEGLLHGHDAFRVWVKEENTAVVRISRRRGGVGWVGGVIGWCIMRKGEEGRWGRGWGREGDGEEAAIMSKRIELGEERFEGDDPRVTT